MDIDEIDRAARAGSHERFEPVNPHRVTPAVVAHPVAHAGSAQFHVACRMGGHVLPERGGGGAGGHVGLACLVGLVEGHEIEGFAAGGGLRGVDVRGPGACEGAVGGVKHGDVFHGGGEGAAGGDPVVAPGELVLVLAEDVHVGGGVVVGEAAFGAWAGVGGGELSVRIATVVVVIVVAVTIVVLVILGIL